MDYHLEQLHRHCRICGNRLLKTKGKSQPVYSCADHTDDLVCFAGLDSVTDGDEFLLPPKFCNVCYMKLRRLKKAKEAGTPSHPIQPLMWTSHTDDCKVRSKTGL